MARETPNKKSQVSSAHSKKLGPLCSKNGAADIYDSEAAQNAFFNAPKVTRRQFVRTKSVAEGGTVEEEESDQQYDENNDVELNSKIAGFMQEFISKKITANNAFETQIFEKLNNVVEVESLQCVGTMLDAGARVYAFRVDNTHGECFTVRTTIDESRNKRGPAIDDPKDVTASRTNGIGDGYSALEEDDAYQENEEDQRPKRTTQRKTRPKESRMAEKFGQVEDLLKKAACLAERFANISLSDEVIGKEGINDIFQQYVNQMEDLSTLRRVKIPFLNEKPGFLNRTGDEYGIDDPIYHKVAKQFEEGCAQSFINNEVLANRDGSFLILHTNWKNNEPWSAPKTVELSTKYNSIFDQLEGSLERALSREPCNMTLLQEFCEDDSDTEDNSMEDIRLLGRLSQPANRVTQDQLPARREPSMENDGETSSVVSMTEEDKSKKADEELAKFQMFLDDEDDRMVKKDPFDGEDFFNNDFTELLLRDANESDVQKATFHAFSDEDAAVFGISAQLMARIRASLKSDRVLSQELQQNLFDVMGPENRRRLEIVLETKDLTTKEGSTIDVLQSLDFFMTRFVPLIDSVWHATIKKASEDQLVKVGFHFGSKGLQRSAMKSAMKSSKKRGWPYTTPLKTPVQPAPLVTPESREISPPFMSNKSRLVTKTTSVRKKAVSRLKFLTTSKKDKTEVIHEVSDEDNVDPDLCPLSQLSTDLSLMTNCVNHVYFWARPREYPRVYDNQVFDDKDNPMQATDFVDMGEMLGLNENNRMRRSTFVSQPTGDLVDLPRENEPATVIDQLPDSIRDALSMADDQENYDPFEHTVDFGEELELDIDENVNCRVESIDDEALQQVQSINEKAGILNILDHSVVEEFSDIEEDPSISEGNALVKQESVLEDDSHWKAGPNASVIDQETARKLKRAAQIKSKRKLNSQIQEDFKTKLLTELPEDGKVDVVGTANFTDTYDPMEMIKRSMLYKRKSGYWKPTANGPEYVQLRSGYAVRTVELENRQFEEVATVPNSKKKKPNSAREARTPLKDRTKNPQESLLNYIDEDTGVNFYDIDISPARSHSASTDSRLLGDDKDEQLEFNGGIIKIRQSRVKPSMVKRAITAVLSSKENDFNALQSILGSSPVKKKNSSAGGGNVDDGAGPLPDESDDSRLEDSESTDENQGTSFNGSNAPAGVLKVEGDQCFSNLCAYLPEYLSGRTKQDLNVINTFAITLLMCNQHNLRLVQEVDSQTKLVSKGGMADFKIELAKK